MDLTHRMANAFFSDLLSTIAERGRTLLLRGEPSVARQDASELLELCKALLESGLYVNSRTTPSTAGPQQKED